MSISRLSALCIVELSLSYVVRSLSNNPKDELRLFNFCVKFSALASVLFNLVIMAFIELVKFIVESCGYTVEFVHSREQRCVLGFLVNCFI